MAPEKLHLTAIEMAHSKSSSEIATLIETMRPKIPEICLHASDHPVRLVKPILAYDGAAIALSFLPAAGEEMALGLRNQDNYTYHHLRRDLYGLCESTGVDIASRYVLPSAHLTIARFVNQDLYRDRKIAALIEVIESINQDLQGRLWGSERQEGSVTAQWIVGEERSVDCRTMTVWYGDGESEYVSEGTKSLGEDSYNI